MPTSTEEEYVEVFMLKLKSSDIQVFIKEGASVSQYFSSFEGFRGIDILLFSDTDVTVQMRWCSYQLFDKHLPLILNACPVTAWLRYAISVSHQPAILQSIHYI